MIQIVDKFSILPFAPLVVLLNVQRFCFKEPKRLFEFLIFANQESYCLATLSIYFPHRAQFALQLSKLFVSIGEIPILAIFLLLNMGLHLQ